MSETTVSDLGECSLKCDLCKSMKTMHVRESIDDITKEAWWRCLNCKKEYGAKLHFFKNPDGSFGFKTEILWKKDLK